MKRITKKKNPLLITTSATSKNEKWFHSKTKGWCFDQNSLEKYFDLNKKLDYHESEKNILNSTKWRKRIDTYYALDKGSEFYKREINNLPYVPIGIKIISE